MTHVFQLLGVSKDFLRFPSTQPYVIKQKYQGVEKWQQTMFLDFKQFLADKNIISAYYLSIRNKNLKLL
jgi:hypothetical protein